MKKFATGALLGFGMLVATAAPAAAVGWYYTGYWYPSAAACEQGYQDLVNNPGGADLPHECRHTGVGVYELWRVG
ncbi:hypothetical protein [Saccharopolyspora sp. NPDC002578]